MVGGGGDCECCQKNNTKVIRNKHITKYEVCAFYARFSKVSQRLLARISVVNLWRLNPEVHVTVSLCRWQDSAGEAVLAGD